jgi:hypothetical protein
LGARARSNKIIEVLRDSDPNLHSSNRKDWARTRFTEIWTTYLPGHEIPRFTFYPSDGTSAYYGNSQPAAARVETAWAEFMKAADASGLTKKPAAAKRTTQEKQ